LPPWLDIPENNTSMQLGYISRQLYFVCCLFGEVLKGGAGKLIQYHENEFRKLN
jgi:hypothetical protein